MYPRPSWQQATGLDATKVHRMVPDLAGPADLLTARDRHAGFVEGLAHAGVPTNEVRVIHGAFSRDGGYAAARRAISFSRPPGALMVSTFV